MAHDPAGKAAHEPTRDELIEEALKSPMTELPENVPKGILGESGIDVRKVDDFEPDLNAGLSQENDLPVIWMAIVLGYMLFGVPGFVILWTSRRIPIRTKVVTSIVMAAGVIAVLVVWYSRR